MAAGITDTAAQFDDFVESTGGALWRAAWLLTGDAQHAEDLVQTALTKTWLKYPDFDSDRHFAAYVRTTIYRSYVSWWRRRSWRSEIPTDELPELSDAEGPDAELRTDLLKALATLPRIQRAVLVLRFFEDRPLAEVAKTLRMPEGTVASHAHRGLKALRTSTHLVDPEESP